MHKKTTLATVEENRIFTVESQQIINWKLRKTETGCLHEEIYRKQNEKICDNSHGVPWWWKELLKREEKILPWDRKGGFEMSA